jgi:hypothetical protein
MIDADSADAPSATAATVTAPSDCGSTSTLLALIDEGKVATPCHYKYTNIQRDIVDSIDSGDRPAINFT